MYRSIVDRIDYELPEPPPPIGPWITEAVCSGMDISLFFPPSGHRPIEALEACSRCPVRQECLDYAIDNNQHWGVWGGLTERQRFSYKRKRRLFRDLIEFGNTVLIRFDNP